LEGFDEECIRRAMEQQGDEDGSDEAANE